jgi:hypothetical protein
VANRGLAAKSPIHDLSATQRVADYLDYGKRGGMGMGGMGAPASPKEAQSQAADQGVGFDGGGTGVDEPPTPVATPPVAQTPASEQFSGKGDSKIGQAKKNLGQATVHGVWSYQGSKPFFYRGRLYAAMGDALVCVDPKTESVLWKKEFHPPKAKNRKDVPQDGEVLDATIGPPALCNGKVFLGTSYGDVVCLSAEQGELLWQANLGKSQSIGFQPAVARGRVYVSTESGRLYCLETGDLQDDGWLMWGANAAHNGMVNDDRRPAQD